MPGSDIRQCMTTEAENWALPRDVAVPRLVEKCGGQLYGLSSRICAIG